MKGVKFVTPVEKERKIPRTYCRRNFPAIEKGKIGLALDGIWTEYLCWTTGKRGNRESRGN
jgi:hypothetical protein